jgi:predicted pyridoxine 5'-phosphate oxidase superfamily flavin-nucleotide-binding protein
MSVPDMPFHSGEIAVQTRTGFVEEVSSRSHFIRNYMPDQHRKFFEKLPFVFLGVLDVHGRPWAIPVWSDVPFAFSVDPACLQIDAPLPFKELLSLDLTDGAKIGVLGIELTTRRRNRVNGTLVKSDLTGLTLKVDQSFGNCPRYIQQRKLTLADPSEVVVTEHSTFLLQRGRDVVNTADTFFIASRSVALDDDPSNGVDVSHRGGRPGFIHAGEDGLLTFPDFAGNRYFNTLGNIEEDGRVGLCFPDWNTGGLLLITGRATIIWDPERVGHFEGAERLVEVRVEDSLLTKHTFAVKGDLIEASPVLDSTGTWLEAQGGSR